VASTWIIEAVDVFEYGDFSLTPGLPGAAPDQFGLDGFEEGLNSSIVITVPLATHRYFEAMLTQTLLIIVRAILAAAIGMMNAARRRPSKRNSHVERPHCQITLEPVADSPANYAARMQINHHCQIQPALAGPDVTDVTGPFPVRGIGHEVTIQQIGCDVEAVIAVGCCLVFAGSDHFEAILAHQTAHTTMANAQTGLFQLLRHTWPAVASKAQVMLFSYVSQQH